MTRSLPSRAAHIFRARAEGGAHQTEWRLPRQSPARHLPRESWPPAGFFPLSMYKVKRRETTVPKTDQQERTAASGRVERGWAGSEQGGMR